MSRPELGDLQFWSRPASERDDAFGWLRAHEPIAFHEERSVIDGGSAGPGFWSVTRHAEVREISRLARVFSSAKGNTITEWSPQKVELFGSMIAMDDPRHAQLRLLVQKGFTPREVARIEDSIRARTRALMERVRDRGPGVFDGVTELAAPMPLQVVCDMLGVPAADERQILDWSNVILTPADPEFGGSASSQMDAAKAIVAYGHELGRDRLAHPRDDIPSILMHAEVDGERLSARDFGAFFLLLASAGNETTRTSISHGLAQLTRHPDQRTAWASSFDALAPTAVEEIVRHASPVLHMRRTALVDTEIGGQAIAAGDKIAMWYYSANRDEAVFDRPHEFDITRTNARDQVGFGAGGPHFCLGANLARREIAVFFEELFRLLPQLEVVGEPEPALSSFINGIKHLPCSLGA